MDFRAYLSKLLPDAREAFARRCKTSAGHLRNVAYGSRPCSPELAIEIERESGGVIPVELLCPAVDWAYLRGTAKRAA